MQLEGQKSVTTDWIIYSNHTSKPSESQVTLPVLTQATEWIEAKENVIVNKGTEVTFKTLPKGFIHLNGQFHVQKGAFFQAHQANFKENVRYEENVTLHAMPELSLSSYPNPFTERLFLSFQLEKETEVSILLFDPTGHLVQQIANQKPLGAGTQENEMKRICLVLLLELLFILFSQLFHKYNKCVHFIHLALRKLSAFFV